DLAQLAREPIPAPIRMGRQQSPHLRQLRRANLPPLNDQTVIHTLTLHLPPSRVQPKMKLFSACLPASCPSSFLPVKRKDLNSYGKSWPLTMSVPITELPQTILSFSGGRSVSWNSN